MIRRLSTSVVVNKIDLTRDNAPAVARSDDDATTKPIEKLHIFK